MNGGDGRRHSGDTGGGRDAFERLVAEYGGELVSLGARLSGNREEARDLVQEAFIRLSREWRGDSCEPSAAIRAWLRRTVHNLSVDSVRGAARRAALHERSAERISEHVPPAPGQGGDGGVPDAAAEAAEALRLPPARERQLVALKVYEGLSYREMSDLTGIPEGTVGYLLHEAMKKLAAHLARKGALR